MRQLLFLCFLLFHSWAYGQQGVIHPKQGEITFITEIKVIDAELYQKSVTTFRDSIAKALKEKFFKEAKANNIDTSQINEIINAMADFPLDSLFLVGDQQLSQHKYQDSIITYYGRSGFNGSKINIKEATESIGEGIPSQPYAYTKASERKLTEFKDQRREINGYDCYKISVTTRDGDLDDIDVELARFINTSETTQELWVTESIQSMFHPIVRDSEILKKYYPLEITEYSNMIKGVRHTYQVKSISLSN